jgi:hypothetical protein
MTLCRVRYGFDFGIGDEHTVANPWLPINLAAVPYPHDLHTSALIIDLIDHPILSDPDAPIVL